MLGFPTESRRMAMTTTSKQLRRKHRKSPKPHKQGSPISRISALERLQALEPAYVIYRSRTVASERARIDWALLSAFMASEEELESLPASEIFEPSFFSRLLGDILRVPGATTCRKVELLDGYLHFLQDTGRWPRADSFELTHLMLLMRVPGVAGRRTSPECPISFPSRHGHGLTLVQWAAHLLDEMLEGKFNPGSKESLAYPVEGPEDVVLLAPGLDPLPFTVFKNLFDAMDKADLFEREDEENFWDDEEDCEPETETSGDLYPTYSGLILMEDDHPQNQNDIQRLLTAYLRIVVMAHAPADAGLAGLRRAELFISVLGKASSAPKANRGAHSLSAGVRTLSIQEQTKKQLSNQFGEISASVLGCIKAGILEYVDGTLVAQRPIREAITTLRKEHTGAVTKN